MIVHEVSIPSINRDNDAAYLNHVRYTVETIDPDAIIYVSKSENILTFHVNPSNSLIRQELINKLLEYHRMLRIKIEFSKSLKIQTKISFKINFNE
ncbi:MAG TPA: hypothetical protein VGD26_10385 [Chitinophagaceae bacterium]|jgi:hypothetical protein